MTGLEENQIQSYDMQRQLIPVKITLMPVEQAQVRLHLCAVLDRLTEETKKKQY